MLSLMSISIRIRHILIMISAIHHTTLREEAIFYIDIECKWVAFLFIASSILSSRTILLSVVIFTTTTTT